MQQLLHLPAVLLDAALQLPRLHGDAAAIGSRTAILTADGACVVLEGHAEMRRIPLGATPAAGVVAAHGAFWIGTIDGGVIRIDAQTLEPRATRVTKNRAAVVGIGAGDDGVYASTAHGSLVALDRAGAERWRREKIGDLVGAPARCGDVVAVAARDGVVTLFRVKDGTSARRFVDVGRPRSGLLSVGPTLLLVRADGFLWACDAASGTLLVDATTPASGVFAPTVLPGARVALPYGQGRLGVIPGPRLPAK